MFEYLCVIWGRYADPNTITAELLSPAGSGTLTKAFYFLLHQHRSSTLEERGIFMDIDEPSLLNARGEKFITRLYMAPLSKKPRPLSADSTPAPMSGFAFPLHTSDERMSAAPPAYQPTWAQGPVRRTRPGSPAGPRAHRPRPISSPPPAHALSHPSLTAPNMTPLSNSSSPSHARTFYGGPRVPPAAAYIEQPNPFVVSGQAHPHEHSTGFMVPLGPITASPLSGALPPVSAPRISNATFQRTIDDIAGRMNVLNAAFARAQIQARADAAQAHARFRTLPMLGQYPAPAVGLEKEPANVHEAVSSSDKENASIEQVSSGRRRPSTSHTAEDGQVTSGIGFGKANGSGVLRKEIGNIAIPPEAVTRMKKDRRSKRKSARSVTDPHSSNNHVAPFTSPAAPTLDFHDSTPRNNGGSPVLGSPKSLLVPPAVGEVKGWFSSLFHWRTHAVALRSRDSVASTRAEARRLLAPVLLPADPQADGALRARLEDAYDPSTGHIVQKAVRFRVEFAVGRGSGGGGGSGGCTMTLVQEKGSVSAFRAVCARLRAEWTLDALEPQTPGMPPAGFGGEDADSRLVNV